VHVIRLVRRALSIRSSPCVTMSSCAAYGTDERKMEKMAIATECVFTTRDAYDFSLMLKCLDCSGKVIAQLRR